LGLPFIVLGLLFRRMSGVLGVLRRNARGLQVAGGGLLVVVWLAIATGLWDQLMYALRPLIDGVYLPI
ncbi:MAG: cytochrome c biogenesis protein CcdA, partial [Actinomycetota bacterium]